VPESSGISLAWWLIFSKASRTAKICDGCKLAQIGTALTVDWQECQKLAGDSPERRDATQLLAFAFNYLPPGLFWAFTCF
jgi:hypothetical protein